MAKPVVELPADKIKIVKLLANGKSLPEIAALIGVNARSLERHVTEIKKSCSCATLPQLVAYCFRNGLII